MVSIPAGLGISGCQFLGSERGSELEVKSLRIRTEARGDEIGREGWTLEQPGRKQKSSPDGDSGREALSELHQSEAPAVRGPGKSVFQTVEARKTVVKSGSGCQKV